MGSDARANGKGTPFRQRCGRGAEKMRTGWESGQDGECPWEGKRQRSSCEELGECASWNAFCIHLGCGALRALLAGPLSPFKVGSSTPGHRSLRLSAFRRTHFQDATLVHLSMLSPWYHSSLDNCGAHKMEWDEYPSHMYACIHVHAKA